MTDPSPPLQSENPVLDLWRQGGQLHQQGRLTEALATYDEVARLAPDFADVYLNRGVAHLSLNHAGAALEDVDRLLALQPDRVAGLNLRGVILHSLGRFDAALDACEAALRLDPDHAYAHNNRGLALQALGRFEEALASYSQALRLDPRFAAVHANRGAVLARLGWWTDALAAYDAAIMAKPDDAQLRHDSAAVLEADGRLEEACIRHRQGIASSPTVDGYNSLGGVLLALNRFEEAAEAHQQALDLAPDLAETSFLIGRLLSHTGRADAARLWFERTVRSQTTDWRSLNGRGLALNALWRFEEAAELFSEAIRRDPQRADLHHNLGIALHELGRADEVQAHYDRAIELDPGNALYRTDRGLHRLMTGDFSAWAESEWRKQTQGRIGWLDSPAPSWTGAEALQGKTVLAYCEQGLGDTIQFCRYLPLLVERGADLVFSVQPPLKALLSTLGPEIRVVGSGEQPGGFDYHVSVMSLPWAFKTKAHNIPAQIPYLKAKPARVDRWRRRLGAAGLRIGVAWQGSARGVEIGKSFEVEALQPIADLKGVRLISLQKGVTPEGLARLEGLRIQDLGEDFDAGAQGFLDTAAVMESLDLVITTDTSVAHLAGALGRPTWIALKHVPDWRWGYGGETTPWYPTARLFRQAAINDWSHVFGEMAELLRERLAAAS